jgi:hypothetical protein
MQQYDTVLKTLFAPLENTLCEHVVGARHVRALNVELPSVTQKRVDSLFESDDKPPRVIHWEFQSENDSELPFRMAEYSLRVFERVGILPEQFVLYVGMEPLRMAGEFGNAHHYCKFKLIDIREIDAEFLLTSPKTADHIMAILAGRAEPITVVRRILAKIAAMEKEQMRRAFEKLVILAGLRKLGTLVEEEARRMPITESILNHDLLGPVYQEGQAHEASNIVRRLLVKRFGEMSPSAEKRFNTLSVSELEEMATKILDAGSLSELLG